MCQMCCVSNSMGDKHMARSGFCICGYGDMWMTEVWERALNEGSESLSCHTDFATY